MFRILWIVTGMLLHGCSKTVESSQSETSVDSSLRKPMVPLRSHEAQQHSIRKRDNLGPALAGHNVVSVFTRIQHPQPHQQQREELTARNTDQKYATQFIEELMHRASAKLTGEEGQGQVMNQLHEAQRAVTLRVQEILNRASARLTEESGKGEILRVIREAQESVTQFIEELMHRASAE